MLNLLFLQSRDSLKRRILGYDAKEKMTREEFIQEKYCGVRPALGYPACQDHTEKWKLFRLLNIAKKLDITLTETGSIIPASAVAGWYFSHPQSKYFPIGKIRIDQLRDYAIRKDLPLQEAKKWLATILSS